MQEIADVCGRALAGRQDTVATADWAETPPDESLSGPIAAC
ncbi:hypothetical protein ABH940_006667 [Streptacidiphilus sp. BW17]